MRTRSEHDEILYRTMMKELDNLPHVKSNSGYTH